MGAGIFFYWFSWIFWIIITFLMNKSKFRTVLAYWILLSIIVSPFTLMIGGYSVAMTVFLLLFGTILLLVRQQQIIFNLFKSFTIMVGYTSLLFWEKISPIWIIAPRIILFSIIIGSIVTLISRDFYSRIGICLLGMLVGEVIYSFILASYGLHEHIGEMIFLDTLSWALLLLTILDILHKGKRKISKYNTKLQTKLEVAK
ncbi:hypothetical protein D8M06_02400 [Oceanobacillus halophilus]|uniref:Uncharacterized protein n=1 Tax=Oceanobacillus halophilus TaxID=930130 RepID=A0A495AG56_9BACI|nr:hypothetical protein D8M06_02400 [Oceanobacillus halophilus]